MSKLEEAQDKRGGPQRGSRSQLRLPLVVLLALFLAGCQVTPLPALPTSAPGLPQPTAALSGPELPVPAIYARDGSPGQLDYSLLHPEYGPVGGHIRVRWGEIHPGRDRYDWEAIDKDLRAIENMTITLASGQVVPKPVLLTLAIYSQLGADSNSFIDHSPDWLKQELGGSYMLGSGACPPQPAPRYNDPVYRLALKEIIGALGARYEDNDRITAITIAAGYDDETAATRLREVGDCSYGQILYRNLVSRDEYKAFVFDTMLWYRQAFPSTPLYIQAGNAEWEHREAFLDYASKLSPPVGYKPNVIAPDMGAAYGWTSTLKDRGFIQLAEEYRHLIPLAYEPKAAPYHIAPDERREHAYWMTLNALAHDADFIAFQSFCSSLETSECSWLPYLAALDDPPDGFGGFISFVSSNLAQTLDTASDVWIVLRDSEHEFNGYSSGEPGDWDRGLARVTLDSHDATSIVWQDQLPTETRDQVYSRQLRRTGGQPLLLNVADEWAHHPQTSGETAGSVIFHLRIWYVDYEFDHFTITYRDLAGGLHTETVQKRGTNRVIKADFALPGLYLDNQLSAVADLVIDDLGDGDEYLHLVWLRAASF